MPLPVPQWVLGHTQNVSQSAWVNGVHHLSCTTGTTENERLPALGIFPMSVYTTSHQSRDIIDLRMSLGSRSLEEPLDLNFCHIGFDNNTVGRRLLVCLFMKGVCCLRPVSKPLALSWDLAIVLETISQKPFEPLESVELKYLSFKKAFLISLTSAK